MSSSTEAPTELHRVADSLRTECQRKANTLRRQFDFRLQETAEAIDERHRELAERVAAGNDRLATVIDAYDQMRRQTDGELRGARQAIARLTGEVHLIEGRLRLEHGVQPVDLDTVPPEIAPLVTTVRAAEQIRAGMLSKQRETELAGVLRTYGEMKRLTAQSRARALDASRALARERIGSRAFRRAAAAYRQHGGQFRIREKAVMDLLPNVYAAEGELRRDARRRQAHIDQRGAEVVADLTGYLRRRIDLAVEQHALFPAWFTITGLGHRPSGNRCEQWRDLAAQVLLYRLTYQVEHAVLALGEPPADRYRAERYNEIRTALQAWDD
ncbi:hypothetical protein [Actinoplanes sp. TFC3]|uniref:hypothetical protein n=1 Tax=Actinoplanes sp. TFC3 TaxID=1710355 RepID=UPI000832504B|nr:hypothetical protein [Actinoplanes sp. TFC3]